MAIFTMRLKDALESGGGSYNVVGGIAHVTKPEVIGLAYYPVFRPDYRERLNGLIFDEYMNREIGMETVEMFAQAVRRRMNLQMPILNKLYESAQLEFDPLTSVDLRTLSSSEVNQSGESEGTANTDASVESGNRVVNQEFPQHALKGNADYASSGVDTRAFTDNKGTQLNSGKTSDQSNSKNESQTIGRQTPGADLIMRYRESLLNVDQMVIDSLKDCFMNVVDTPESFTNRGTFNAYYSPIS